MNSTSRLPQAVALTVLLPLALSLRLLAQAPEESQVDEVRFEPAKLLKKAEIAQLLTRTVPGPWDDVSIKASQANVMQTGRFSAVDVRFTTEEGRRVMTLALSPRPYVKKFEVSGVTQLSKADLLRRLDLKTWRYLTEEAEAGVPAQVVEAYTRSGLPPPEVRVESLEPKENGATTVKISVVETPLPKLQSFDTDLQGVPWLSRLTMTSKFLVFRWSAKAARYNKTKLEKVTKKEQKRLRELGFKSAVFSISEEPAGPDGTDRAVKVAVDLGPREQLKGKGVDRPVMSEVAESWKRRNVPLTEGVVNRLARSATEGMKERGYLDAVVKPKSETKGDRKTVVLEASHGERVFVSGVRFEGNATLPEKELSKEVFLTAPRVLGLSKSRPGPGSLSDCEAALAAHYARQGFPAAKVTSRLDGTGPGREVVFTIEEGERQVVSSLTFPGAMVLSEPALRKLTKLQEGNPYWPTTVGEAALSIRKAYMALGYGSATVTQKPVAGANGQVAVAFEVVEGMRHTLARSIVRNNFKTGAGRILSEGDEKQGKPIDPEQIGEHQTRLASSGLFDSVSIRTEEVPGSGPPGSEPPGAEPPQKVAVIEVAERPTAFVEYGLDINTQRGIELAGTIGDRNLLGHGVLGSVSILAGKERQNLGLEMSRPVRILGKRLFGTLKAGYNSDSTYEGYTLLTISGEAGLTWELDSKRRITAIYTLEQQKPTDIQPDVAEELAPLTVRIGSITPSISLDLRDDPFNTKRGWYLMAKDKISRTFLAGDTDYDRWELDARWFKTLQDMWTAAAALRLGYTATEGGSDLPVGERFYIGGANTHRGFEEKGLGPLGSDGSPLGGESYVLANLEMRFPVFGPLGAGVFLDVGNAYASPGMDLSDLRWAAGAGLRLNTPVGPLRFDAGYKLDRQPGESSYVLHIALGHAF